MMSIGTVFEGRQGPRFLARRKGEAKQFLEFHIEEGIDLLVG